jgi:hypothetical protein
MLALRPWLVVTEDVPFARSNPGVVPFPDLAEENVRDGRLAKAEFRVPGQVIGRHDRTHCHRDMQHPAASKLLLLGVHGAVGAAPVSDMLAVARGQAAVNN